MKEIPLTKDDINNTIKEIDNYIKDTTILDGEYKLFTQEELEENLDKIVGLILERLK